MAASFPRDARVLRFNPRAPAGYQGRRRDVLWPVLAYRVGVPVAHRAEQMDLFQRAVFGVLLHGVNDPQQIADILNLHPDLVRIVKSFLVDRDLIDQDDIVKPDAERRYREARFDLGRRADGFTTGYVFQDPFSGLLLPRLVETLETADFTVQENGFPELHRGERVLRPYVEFPPAEKPAPPRAEDVMRAFEASRKARKGRWESGDEDGEGAEAKFLSRVRRVNFIEREPEVMYLSTFIFGHGLSGWEVADPFGLPTSPLTALAHRRLAASKHLRAAVQRLSAESPEADRAQHDPVEDALASLQHEFGPQVDGHPLLQPLLDAELAAAEFRAAPDSQRPRRARQALGAVRTLAEHLLREVRSRHTAAGAARQLIDRDALYNLRRIEAAAGALAFTVPLPATLTSVKASDVHWMANREQSGKLRPLLVGLLLSAGAHPEHPFHAAARSAPDFFQQFDELLGWCGEAAHVGTAPAEFERWVEPALARAYQATHLLLGEGGPAHPAPGPTFRVAPEPQDPEFDDLEL
ncbi:hypothetical protein [Deinococcus sedimenti]|uniref:Uncharacterized protein n=1 Tax=Deinococcus sedimenti TaxID=1867090 RepID=A0ABQ2S9N7_9DEIO|nr:hypothetical protein [Deinococcus sedimenti]GGS05715.1 hypothetical protein GCM10008960_35270 [Deinococcus sedimenti]